MASAIIHMVVANEINKIVKYNNDKCFEISGAIEPNNSSLAFMFKYLFTSFAIHKWITADAILSPIIIIAYFLFINIDFNYNQVYIFINSLYMN